MRVSNIGRKNCLEYKIKKTFPTIRLPQDYVKILRVGKKLKALDYKSATKGKNFLKEGVKKSAFINSYDKFGIVNAIKNADRTYVVYSQRENEFLWDLQHAIVIVHSEIGFLYNYIKLNKNARILTIRCLKLSTSIQPHAILQYLRTRDHFDMASKYEIVYSYLKNHGMTPQYYKWLGVRSTHVSHYYPSTTSKKILAGCP